MDDLIERCGEQHGMCLVGDDCGNLHTMWEAGTALIELRARIAALEADNARLMGLVKEAGEAMQQVEPHLDAIVCFASTQAEYEPNRIAATFRSTLAKIKEARDA